MIICKSQIKIFKKGEEPSFNCELLVNRNIKLNSQQVILIAQNKDGSYQNHNIEELRDTHFYSYLKNLILKHEEYQVLPGTEYLLSLFESNNAQNYIDINECSDPFSFEEEIDKKEKIYAKVTTYELDFNMILKNILMVEEEKDLYSDTFSNRMDRYISEKIIEKKIMEKIDFLKSIKVHRSYNGVEDIEVKKINGHKVFNIILDSLENNGIKIVNRGKLKYAYVKGIYRYNKKGKRTKNIEFFEDEYGFSKLFIVDRGKYTVGEIINIFCMNSFIYFDNLVIGVSTIDDVKLIYEF
ncbi:MAG: hypothetical protein ACI4ON_05370 [Clostridia bacterium]